MSRTITISDELYLRLEAEARARGIDSVERLLEEKERQVDLAQRKDAVKRIGELRERLFAKHGVMPDSVELLREDRSR